MYEIEIERGNGYACGCCRKTWLETEEFETYEEAAQYAAELTFKRDHSARLKALGEHVNADMRILRIYRVTDDDGIDQDLIKELQKDMLLKLQEREYEVTEARKKNLAAAKCRREAVEKKKYEELKKKYEGGVSPK